MGRLYHSQQGQGPPNLSGSRSPHWSYKRRSSNALGASAILESRDPVWGVLTRDMAVSKNQGPILVAPTIIKDDNIFGSILGPPHMTIR